MEYGSSIDNYNIREEQFYDLITNYYDNPTLTKVKNISNSKANSNSFSMYMARIDCLLYTEYRYIVVLIKEDQNPIGENRELSDLKWISFQTRILPERHNVEKFQHVPKKTLYFQPKISMTKRTTSETTYSCQDYPIIVTLLHLKKNLIEYSENGTIASALETFKTIITFVD
jgi:hypothetical protein